MRNKKKLKLPHSLPATDTRLSDSSKITLLSVDIIATHKTQQLILETGMSTYNSLGKINGYLFLAYEPCILSSGDGWLKGISWILNLKQVNH